MEKNHRIGKAIGLKMIDKAIPRTGYLLKNEGGEVIGEITSGTQSPTLNQGIAFAILKGEFASNYRLGDVLGVEVRGHFKKAEICRRAFFKKR